MAKISAYGATKVATWTKMGPQAKTTLTLTSDGRILARSTFQEERGSYSTSNTVVARVPKDKLDRALEIADRYATRRGFTRS